MERTTYSSVPTYAASFQIICVSPAQRHHARLVAKESLTYAALNRLRKRLPKRHTGYRKMIRIVRFPYLTLLICFFALNTTCCVHMASTPLGKKILLTYTGPATTVCVSSALNDWAMARDCMVRENGRWELHMALPPGRFVYALVVDGVVRPDPLAQLHEDDEFGNINSVLVVP